MARIDIINNIGEPTPTTTPDINHPVNVLTVNRILTKANPAGMPTVDPIPLKGMMDVVAQKPMEHTTLINENGAPEVSVIDYTTDAVRGGDVLDNTRPERLAAILAPVEPTRPYEMGLVSRIAHQIATYHALNLAKTELPDDVEGWCADEEARTLALLDGIEQMQERINHDRA